MDFDVTDLKVAAGIVVLLHSGMLYVLVADQVLGLRAEANIVMDDGMVAHVAWSKVSKVASNWYK